MFSLVKTIKALDLNSKYGGVVKLDAERIKTASLGQCVGVRPGRYEAPLTTEQKDDYLWMFSNELQPEVDKYPGFRKFLTTMPTGLWKWESPYHITIKEGMDFNDSIKRANIEVRNESRDIAFYPQMKRMKAMMEKHATALKKGVFPAELRLVMLDFRGGEAVLDDDKTKKVTANDQLEFFEALTMDLLARAESRRDRAELSLHLAMAYNLRIANLRKRNGEGKVQCKDGEAVYEKEIKGLKKKARSWENRARLEAFGGPTFINVTAPETPREKRQREKVGIKLQQAIVPFEVARALFEAYWTDKDPKARAQAMLRVRVRGIYEYKVSVQVKRYGRVRTEMRSVRFEDPLFKRSVSFMGTLPGADVMMCLPQESFANRIMYMSMAGTVVASPVSIHAKAAYMRSVQLAEGGCEMDVQKKKRRGGRRWKPRTTKKKTNGGGFKFKVRGQSKWK